MSVKVVPKLNGSVILYMCVCLGMFPGTNVCAEVAVKRGCWCGWLCKREEPLWNGGWKQVWVLWPKGRLLPVCFLLLSCPSVHLLSPIGLEGGWATLPRHMISWKQDVSELYSGYCGGPYFRSDSSAKCRRRNLCSWVLRTLRCAGHDGRTKWRKWEKYRLWKDFTEWVRWGNFWVLEEAMEMSLRAMGWLEWGEGVWFGHYCLRCVDK